MRARSIGESLAGTVSGVGGERNRPRRFPPASANVTCLESMRRLKGREGDCLMETCSTGGGDGDDDGGA